MGNVTRIENIFADIPERPKDYIKSLEDVKRQLEVAKAC
jgi:hypothetical protein